MKIIFYPNDGDDDYVGGHSEIVSLNDITGNALSLNNIMQKRELFGVDDVSCI